MAEGRTPAKLTVDFTGVDVSKGAARVDEGDYLVKVIGVTHQPKKDDPTKFNLNWKLQIVEPSKFAGKVVYYRTSLVKEYLWSLRGFLIDMLGESKVPKSSLDIPLAKIVKAQPLVGVTLVDDEPYNGKVKSKVSGTFSKKDWESLNDSASTEEEEDEDEQEEDEEEEEEAPKKTKKAKAAVTESEEDEDMEDIDLDDI